MTKILKFEATWCNPCKQLTEVFEKNNYFGTSYVVYDADSNKEDFAKHNVRSVPTVIKVDNNGHEVSRFHGVKDADFIHGWININ